MQNIFGWESMGDREMRESAWASSCGNSFGLTAAITAEPVRAIRVSAKRSKACSGGILLRTALGLCKMADRESMMMTP